eukprot:1394914-Prymnesium_polylepis.2
MASKEGRPHLGDEDGVVLAAALEALEQVGPLVVARRAIDHRPLKTARILLQREDVVGEDDDLVAALLMRAHQVLARAELRRRETPR